jgi:hypothetical protein
MFLCQPPFLYVSVQTEHGCDTVGNAVAKALRTSWSPSARSYSRKNLGTSSVRPILKASRGEAVALLEPHEAGREVTACPTNESVVPTNRLLWQPLP